MCVMTEVTFCRTFSDRSTLLEGLICARFVIAISVGVCVCVNGIRIKVCPFVYVHISMNECARARVLLSRFFFQRLVPQSSNQFKIDTKVIACVCG